jgi:transcriptional regulator
MYVHPAFKVHPAASLAFAAARGFGLVIACDAGRPVAAHLPFRLIEQDGKVPKLEFHVARANPLGLIAEKGGTWLVAVQGHDAYVSPDWYASAEQVPTWLYEAVHLSGVAHLREHDENRSHGDALLAVSEARLLKQPWDLAQMEPTKRETMLASIRVIDLVVDQIEGQSKLNQHKSDEDHVAVAEQLARAEETGSAEGWPRACGRCGRSCDMSRSAQRSAATSRHTR